MDRLLTPEQACAALSCHRTMLFRLLASGALASVKLGRLRRIPESAVDAYIAARLADAGQHDGEHPQARV
jgi:excisionase family DNA binding protein